MLLLSWRLAEEHNDNPYCSDLLIYSILWKYDQRKSEKACLAKNQKRAYPKCTHLLGPNSFRSTAQWIFEQMRKFDINIYIYVYIKQNAVDDDVS